MRLGTFETYPAIFSTRWAIVLFGDEWSWIHPAEMDHGAQHEKKPGIRPRLSTPPRPADLSSRQTPGGEFQGSQE